MKIFLALCISIILLSCANEAPVKDEERNITETISFEDYNQKISYAIGLDHGSAGRARYSDPKLFGKLDFNEINNGLVDYLESNPLLVTPDEVDSVLNLFLMADGKVDSTLISVKIGSYAIGINEALVLVTSLVNKGIDQEINASTLVKGIKDGMNGIRTAYALKEAQDDLFYYYGQLNKKNGESFLKENKNKDGVTTTESGLQYFVYQEGNGNHPKAIDSIEIHYASRFISGETFENTKELGPSVKFPVMQVVKGWTEGLLLMSPGAKYRFFIPYELAYGEEGGGPVEPFSTLIFDVEMIDVISYSN